MGNDRNGKLLYHLTALENLDSIFQSGLRSRVNLNSTKNSVKNVADDEIIDSRKQYNLDKYVPFHFLLKTLSTMVCRTRTPMWILY